MNFLIYMYNVFLCSKYNTESQKCVPTLNLANTTQSVWITGSSSLTGVAG